MKSNIDRIQVISIFVSSLLLFAFWAAAPLNVSAQYGPGVIEKLKGSSPPMQTLTGVIRVNKSYGVIPSARGSSRPGSPCGQFYVAILDPDNRNKPINTTTTDAGRDDGDFYTCKYSLSAPANKRLYAIAGMGGTNLLPQTDRWELYITDAWIGGTNNKPRRGWERGFAGKFVTLGVKPVYLRFDMYYAQVDPD